jgi:23S rRNA pseudouridine955/2504/2580 synthase
VSTVAGSRPTRVLQPGQTVRVPPLGVDEKSTGPLTAKTIRNRDDGDVLSQMLLHEDSKVLVFNKPAGLAVQGGSGVTRNVDDMLEAWRNKKGEKPRLVHRLDRDTAGVLVVARTRGAAQALTAAFRERTTKKTYWALVKGVPRTKEGKISTWLIKEATEDGDRMRIAKHGEQGADHAVSYYRDHREGGTESVLAGASNPIPAARTSCVFMRCTWGIRSSVIPKYFEFDKNWEFPSGMQNRLHLLARHISMPHPDGGRLSVTAPLPPHMVQSWNLLGFDEATGGEHEE